jgi:broad specificity phosphatase PhoE
MKVYFVRHGEAMDDVKKEFGGWANEPLSEKGKVQVGKRAANLKERSTQAELIYTSPFKRARESADILAQELGLPVEEDIYLKERNTYGLLCGVGEEEASQKYPELLQAHERGKEVLGYEPYIFFLKRVQALVARLAKCGKESIVCVTHGKLLKALLEDVVGGIKVKKLYDACLVVTEFDSKGKLGILELDGVESAK